MAKVQTIESFVFAFFIQIMHKYEKTQIIALKMFVTVRILS